MLQERRRVAVEDGDEVISASDREDAGHSRCRSIKKSLWRKLAYLYSWRASADGSASLTSMKRCQAEMLFGQEESGLQETPLEVSVGKLRALNSLSGRVEVGEGSSLHFLTDEEPGR